MQVSRFEIIGHHSPRPDAERIIFCDGAGGSLFRPTTDLELSHWRPNRTPIPYRAATSTEICFRFLDDPIPGEWTAVVNNHTDVDGILSMYVLTHGPQALAHRQTIIQAAEAGDFWGWGSPEALRLFQGITRLMNCDSPVESYREAFRRIPGLIDGTDPESSRLDQSLDPLWRSVELVEQGKITRRLLHGRVAHYVIPFEVAGANDARSSYVAEFNEAVSENALLWPQARARWDRERTCLQSTERRGGWFHDLWFPGYLWADVEGHWKVPGLHYHNGMASYELSHQPLIDAFAKLQNMEMADGFWGLGGTQTSHADKLTGRFPLVGRFINNAGTSAASRLSPDQVAEKLESVFA